MARRRMRLAVIVASTVVVVACAGCSWKRLDDADPAVASGEMRPVPTVTAMPAPSSTAPGEGGGAGASGALGDPAGDEPQSDDGPLPEQVIGDLPPDPDDPEPRPGLPDGPTPDACTRLGDVAAADAFSRSGQVRAATVATELLGQQGCRLTAGGVVAEVHYIAEEAVFGDWFGREGIDTVGEVGPDAVGLAVWTPPGGTTRAGFTIAMVSRRQGAVVAVSGATDDRSLAVQVALAVAATT